MGKRAYSPKRRGFLGIVVNTIPIMWVALLLLLFVSFTGCGSQSGEGFALYFPAEEIPPSDVTSISHLRLAGSSFISSMDVVSYSRASHTIELTSEALNKIRELEIPTSGRVFVIAVDCQPVYWGAFWTPLSSEIFDGVVILTTPATDGNSVHLQLGYPSDSYFTGDDPRSNPVIIQALEKLGKLQ